MLPTTATIVAGRIIARIANSSINNDINSDNKAKALPRALRIGNTTLSLNDIIILNDIIDQKIEETFNEKEKKNKKEKEKASKRYTNDRDNTAGDAAARVIGELGKKLEEIGDNVFTKIPPILKSSEKSNTNTMTMRNKK